MSRKNTACVDGGPSGGSSVRINLSEDLHRRYWYFLMLMVRTHMTRIEDIYLMWFQVWNVNYIPLIMDRPKWQLEGDNLR